MSHVGTLDDVKDISKTLIEISKKCPEDSQIDILKLVADLLETIPDSNKPLDLVSFIIVNYLTIYYEISILVCIFLVW